MEKLFEYKKVAYHTLLHKDYCEVSEEDLLGNHQSDVPFFFNVTTFRKEFDYLKTFNDEESYNNNYSNPLAHCMLKRVTIVVDKSDDKTSLKLFTYDISRETGRKYFTKQTCCHYITFNHKLNSLFHGFIRNYHKKKKSVKKLFKNNWYTKPIQNLIQLSNNLYRGMKLNNFEDIESSGKAINDAIGIFLSNIPNTNLTIKGYENIIYKRYLDGLGVKVPNNWMYFDRIYPQLTKKIFKKCNYKYVDAFMESHRLNGDKIKRVLHTVNSTSGINNLKFALDFFGNDYILSQNDEIIKSIIESTFQQQDASSQIVYYRSMDKYTKNELKNCFEIFKLTLVGEINYYSFIDHIKYKHQLKNWEPVIWKSNNYDKFTEEHYNWSEKVGLIKNAQYNRFYYEPFKQYLETPINEYFPVLLSEHKEYLKESFEQSNCVRTYADRPDSIIISIRKDSVEGKERATIEYKIKKYDDNLVLKRVQSLGRFNAKLDETWNEVLEKLDERINKSLETNLFELPKVEIKRGSKTCTTDIIFLGGSQLSTDKKISQVVVFEKELHNHKSDNIIDLYV
jgi:hypothetical protein